MLVSWEVRADLPPNRGYGLRRHPVPEKAEVKQRQRRLALDMKRAGQAKGEGGGGSTATGPTDVGAGQATGPAVDPWADALARVRGRLAKARAWQGWINAVPDRTAADLAKREKRTRARVSQVLRLLDLAPAIVEDLERDDRTGPVPSELQLRSIAAIGSVEQQWRRYEQLVRQGDLSMGRRKGEPVARSHGFRADLERARRFQELWDTGAYVSLKELGRLEGITGARVSQLMNLLHLAPEILAALDVPEEQVPASVMKKEVRAIARLRTHAEQVVAFEACCPGVLGSVAAK